MYEQQPITEQYMPPQFYAPAAKPKAPIGYILYAMFLPVMGLFLERYAVSAIVAIIMWALVLILMPITCALDKKMLLNVLCILYFIQILTVTGILPEIVAAFQASPLPVPVVIACVSFIIGVLTGMSQGHVAIVMPIVAAMGTGNLDLAGVAMAFGVAGQMLTPTHMCLVVTVDYFRSNFLGTLRPVLLGEIILLTIFSIYTWFTMT